MTHSENQPQDCKSEFWKTGEPLHLELVKGNWNGVALLNIIRREPSKLTIVKRISSPACPLAR